MALSTGPATSGLLGSSSLTYQVRARGGAAATVRAAAAITCRMQRMAAACQAAHRSSSRCSLGALMPVGCVLPLMYLLPRPGWHAARGAQRGHRPRAQRDAGGGALRGEPCGKASGALWRGRACCFMGARCCAQASGGCPHLLDRHRTASPHHLALPPCLCSPSPACSLQATRSFWDALPPQAAAALVPMGCVALACCPGTTQEVFTLPAYRGLPLTQPTSVAAEAPAATAEAPAPTTAELGQPLAPGRSSSNASKAMDEGSSSSSLDAAA